MVVTDPPVVAAAPPSCTEATSVMTITSMVGASSDDGTQLTTTMALTASTGAIVDATNEYFAVRFCTVTIPSGAVITGATVQMFFPASTNDEPLGTVYFQLSTAAATLTTGASDISNRVPTTSSATWDVANLGAPGLFNTPNLATQLTEVYNLTGSLNDAKILMVYRGNTGARDFQVLTYNNGVSGQMPLLSITYTTSTLCSAENFAIAFTSQTISSASWTANGSVPSPDSYTLQYGTATDFTGTLVSSTTLLLTATVTGLTPATQYYARVRTDPDNFYTSTLSTTTPSAGGGGPLTSDDFNRSDGDLNGDTASGGGTWSDACGGACNKINVASNQLTQTGGDFNWYTISTTLTDADYSADAQVTVGSSGHTSPGLLLRGTASEGYFGYWAGGTWAIYKYTSSTLSSIGSGCSSTNPPTTTRTVLFSAVGSDLTLKSDGATVCTATDSSITAKGNGGVCAIYPDTTPSLDDFNLYD